jgi:citrate synthase
MGKTSAVYHDLYLHIFKCNLGFPLDFFPVLFAVPRVVGWLAHWRQVRTTCSSSDKMTNRRADDATGGWCQDMETQTSEL